MDTTELSDILLVIFPIDPNPNNFEEVHKKLIEFLRDLETYEELGYACNMIGEQYY